MFTSTSTGHPISQEELDLIFDYTCDSCEAYISSELLDKHGWDLKTSEAFLTGKHPEGNKIRYCSETITTSLLNLKFASQFDSLSQPHSSVPNFAHLTTSSSNPRSSASSLQLSSPMFSVPQMSQSTPTLPHMATCPNTSTGNTLENSASNHALFTSPYGAPPSTHPANGFYIPANGSAPSLSQVSIASAAQQTGDRPTLPPKPHKHVHQNHTLEISSSAPDLPSRPHKTHDHALHHSEPGHAADFPQTGHAPHSTAHTTTSHAHTTTSTKKATTDGSGKTGLLNSIFSASTTSAPSKSSKSKLSSPSPKESSSSLLAMNAPDGHIGSSRQACPNIALIGFCSPRECPDRHSPNTTICKWLLTEGHCMTAGCAFQHPNLITRESILHTLRERMGSTKKVLDPEWEALRLRMVFHCTVSMREKKCGKGGDCMVLNCPKQHRKSPKELVTSKQSAISSTTSKSNLKVVTAPASSSAPTSPPTSSNTHRHSTGHGAAAGPGHHSPTASMPPPLPPKPQLVLMDVTNQANHMNLVTSIMQGGCAKAAKPLKIKKLEQITNLALDGLYQEYFKKTQSAKGLRPSEIYAFHGAPPAAITSIATTGFDMSKIKRTKFGHGLYCALDANVSVDYCGDGNIMLLVRLITDGLKWVKDPAYYVIQDSACTNPLYIITFEKT